MRSASNPELLTAILRELRVTNALLEQGVEVLQSLDHRSDAALHGVMSHDARFANSVLAAREVRLAQRLASNADENFRELFGEGADSDE